MEAGVRQLKSAESVVYAAALLFSVVAGRASLPGPQLGHAIHFHWQLWAIWSEDILLRLPFPRTHQHRVSVCFVLFATVCSNCSAPCEPIAICNHVCYLHFWSKISHLPLTHSTFCVLTPLSRSGRDHKMWATIRQDQLVINLSISHDVSASSSAHHLITGAIHFVSGLRTPHHQCRPSNRAIGYAPRLLSLTISSNLGTFASRSSHDRYFSLHALL